mgnify:FL=1
MSVVEPRQNALPQKYISTLWKGAVIGGTMLVPGVSGGSMAMILGIYQELISAVSSFRKQKKSNFLFLTVFCISAVFGMLVIATPISNLIDIFPKPTMYFFIGAVTGGIPLIFREAKATAFSWEFPVYILLGGIIVSAISLFPVNMAGMQEGEEIQNFLFLFAAGAIAAVALILPGISVSYLLLLLGLYDKTMQAISGLQFSFLISLLLGGVIGIILTTKLLEKIMTHFPQPTYLIILGFILGSVISIFPGFPSFSELGICTVTFSVGFISIYLISRRQSDAV